MSLLGQRKLRNRWKRTTATKSAAQFLAVLGDGNGTVVVPGRSNLRYVRPVGETIPMVVKGGSAPDIEGVRVWVGRENLRGSLTILGVASSGGSTATTGVIAHGDTHLAGGADPAYIDVSQVINALCYASSINALTAVVNAGFAIVNSQPVHWVRTNIDMTSHIPESGARYSLIRVDNTGAISVQDGTPVASYADLSWAALPAVADGYRALGIVRLYSGQTAFNRTYSSPDVIPLHLAPETGGGGGGPMALDDLTDVNAPNPSDGQALTWDDAAGEWSPGGGGGIREIFAGETLLDQTAGAGGQDNFTLSSILQTYAYIRIIVSGRGVQVATNFSSLRITFNGDTNNANYRSVVLYNQDSASGRGGADDRIIGVIASSKDANNYSISDIIIPNPGGTVMRKHAYSNTTWRVSATVSELLHRGIQWENTNAISSILIDNPDGKFAQGARCTIIGYRTMTIGYGAMVLDDYLSGRDILKADRNYYVRTDGNDSNDGLSDTSGGAFKTINAAIDFVADNLDLNGYAVTINIGAGTFSGRIDLKSCVGVYTTGKLRLIGSNSTTLSNAGTVIRANDVTSPWDVGGFKIGNSTSGHLMYITNSFVRINTGRGGDKTIFQDSVGYHMIVDGGGRIDVVGDYVMDGNCTTHFAITFGSRGNCGGRAIEVAKTVNVTFDNWLLVSRLSLCGGYSTTYTATKTVTGRRYYVEYNGVAATGGLTLPGSTAGATSNGGYYS